MNIEKLAIEHCNYKGFSEGKLEQVGFSINQLEAFAKSYQAQEGEAVAQITLNNTALKNRIAVLEDLLSSAYNIANREGVDTHWQRYAGQLHINGISPITAKTFKILPSDTDYKHASQARIAELEEAFEIVKKQHIHALNSVIEARATNKTLLDALKAIEFATKPEPDDGSFHENAYTLAQQAIADAEGVDK